MKKIQIALSIAYILCTPLAAHAKAEQAKASEALPAAQLKDVSQITLGKEVAPTNLIKNELSDFQQKPFSKRFIDPMKILPNAKPWKEGTQKLDAELRGRAQQIEEMMKAYGIKEQELRNSANVITPTVKEAKTKELLRIQNNIEIEKQAFEQYRMQGMQELEGRIGNQVCLAAKQYAEAHDIDEIAAAGFVYCKPSLEVSNEILAILNETYDQEMAKRAPAPAKAPVKVAAATPAKPATPAAAPAA